MSDFLRTLAERVIIYDGGMGTCIQACSPTLDDFWGKEGCNELLVLSRPDIVKDIHDSFFRVGCDVVETNTFGATSIVLAEYNLEAQVGKINLEAARLALEVAQAHSTSQKRRVVAGSMSPTTKLPRLGHLSYDDMAVA